MYFNSWFYNTQKDRNINLYFYRFYTTIFFLFIHLFLLLFKHIVCIYSLKAYKVLVHSFLLLFCFFSFLFISFLLNLVNTFLFIYRIKGHCFMFTMSLYIKFSFCNNYFLSLPLLLFYFYCLFYY